MNLQWAHDNQDLVLILGGSAFVFVYMLVTKLASLHYEYLRDKVRYLEPDPDEPEDPDDHLADGPCPDPDCLVCYEQPAPPEPTRNQEVRGPSLSVWDRIRRR